MAEIGETTAAKLTALLPRLGSDQDGEVVATARAIGRQLGAAGMDWHDLAARLIGKPTPATPPLADEADELAEWRAAVEWLLDQAFGALNGKEAAFVASMADLLGRGFEPTAKQGGWIRALLAKTGGTWRRAA